MGADQKGAPVEVVASSGKVNTSCPILGGCTPAAVQARVMSRPPRREGPGSIMCMAGATAAKRPACQAATAGVGYPAIHDPRSPRAPVVEVVLKLEARPADAAVKVGDALPHQHLHHTRQLLARRGVRAGAHVLDVPATKGGGAGWQDHWVVVGWAPCARVWHGAGGSGRQPGSGSQAWTQAHAPPPPAPRPHRALVRVCQVRVCLPGRLVQHALKLRACPGEAVVDVVRERVHCAHGRLPGSAGKEGGDEVSGSRGARRNFWDGAAQPLPAVSSHLRSRAAFPDRPASSLM